MVMVLALYIQAAKLRGFENTISFVLIHISAQMSSSSSVIPIWIKIVGAGAESWTSVRCDPSVTTMDDLKELVKAKCSRRFEHIDAPDLVIKGNGGESIEEDTFLSERGI